MAKPKLIKKIQVTFNLLDQDQLALYQHAKQKANSSGYLKSLVQRDMDQDFYLNFILQNQTGSGSASKETSFAYEQDRDFTVQGWI